MNSSTGEFKCTKATITGTITATSGTIGGYKITSSTLESTGTNKMIMQSTASSANLSWSNGSRTYIQIAMGKIIRLIVRQHKRVVAYRSKLRQLRQQRQVQRAVLN